MPFILVHNQSLGFPKRIFIKSWLYLWLGDSKKYFHYHFKLKFVFTHIYKNYTIIFAYNSRKSWEKIDAGSFGKVIIFPFSFRTQN